MEAHPPAAVQLAGVSKRYGSHAVLQDIDFALKRGECLALLGHNGAGKTTLLKLILGLTRADRGDITYYTPDATIVSATRWRREIGVLPENVAFHAAMTGRELLRFYARLKGVPLDECVAVLERVGLTDAARRRIGTYSKGMRQRLGLAQALLGSPALLLLDEPTTGLDPASRRQFYELVAERLAAGGTALISSHTLSEVERSAERFVILKSGRIVASGTLDQLRTEARLPTRIRVLVAPGETANVAERIGGDVDFHKVNDRVIDLACLEVDKLQVLHRITSLAGPVLDVEVTPANLEQVYAHFTQDGGNR